MNYKTCRKSSGALLWRTCWFGMVLLMMEKNPGFAWSITPIPNNAAPAVSDKKLVAPEQIEAFERDGYILLRGLFSREEIEKMTAAGDALVSISQHGRAQTFSVLEKNLIYGSLDAGSTRTVNDTCTSDSNDGLIKQQEDEEAQTKEMIVQTFRNVALRSKLPTICAELMCLNPERQNLRCIRDVFLAKYVNRNDTCDWHVDDQGFWPESFLSTAAQENPEHDQNGINVWIALDDFSPANGGSMIVSQGSHKAPWRHEAYLSIGQNRSQAGGAGSMEDLVKTISKPDYYGTCSLDMSNPEIRAKAEAGKVEFELQKGDCILATRLCFHRTSRVTEAGMEHYEKLGKTLLHRYSVRYVPGSARLPPGRPMEPSALSNPNHAGQTLDEICGSDKLESTEDQTSFSTRKKLSWYPKLWPELEENVDDKLDEIGQHEMPTVKARMQSLQQEMREIMKKYDFDFKNFRGRS
ncbi:hypothetical protein ACA910_000309 [Epithemia clementina (nom. ined.)]